MIEIDKERDSAERRLRKMKSYTKNKEINVSQFKRKVLGIISKKLQMKTL